MKLFSILICGISAAFLSCTSQGKKLPLKKVNLSYEDRQAWRKVLHWPESCEEAFDYPDKTYGGIQFFPLTAESYLAEVTCTRGAYQGFQVYLYLSETKSAQYSRLLEFKTYEAPGETRSSLVEKHSTELWGTPHFDTAAKELTILNRFRGPGDCGSWARYGFSEGRPELKDFRAKLSCDGKGADAPQEWEKIYSTGEQLQQRGIQAYPTNL